MPQDIEQISLTTLQHILKLLTSLCFISLPIPSVNPIREHFDACFYYPDRSKFQDF